MPDNTCVACGRIIPEGRMVCLQCGDYDDMQTFRPRIRPKPRTNGDRIRAMTNDELVHLIRSGICELDSNFRNCKRLDCDECVRLWLESEVRHE